MNQQNNMPEPEDPETPEEQDPLAPEPEAQPEEHLQEQNVAGDDKVAELEAKLAETRDQALRAMAEAENTRKRLLREREDVRKYAVADFAKDLLDFSDNFRRALDSIPEDAMNDDLVKNVVTGVEAMEKELLKTMEKHGIQKIEPMGETFDPNFHEAMFEAPGTGQQAGTIVELIEPGYVLQDRLLRPARVGIAKDEGQGGGEPPPEGPGGHVDTEA